MRRAGTDPPRCSPPTSPPRSSSADLGRRRRLDLQFAVIGPAIQSCVLVPGAAVSNIVRATILD